MTEHPNYKYRPRRRKHTKSRTSGGTNNGQQSAQQQQQTNNIGQQSNNTAPITHATNNNDVQFDDDTSRYNSYLNGNSNAFTNVTQTPESSPTQSPDPQRITRKCPDVNILNDTEMTMLTPEMSPEEKDPFNHTNGNGGGSYQMKMPSTYSDLLANRRQYELENNDTIKREYPYELNNQANNEQNKYVSSPADKKFSSFMNSSRSSTITAAGKGMYVSTSRSRLDQGHIVRGTFIPPIATSQDHQNLGVTTTTSTVTSGINYSNNHYSAITSNNNNNSVLNKDNNSVNHHQQTMSQVNDSGNYYTTGSHHSYPCNYTVHGMAPAGSTLMDDHINAEVKYSDSMKYPDSNQNFNYNSYNQHQQLYQQQGLSQAGRQILSDQHNAVLNQQFISPHQEYYYTHNGMKMEPLSGNMTLPNGYGAGTIDVGGFIRSDDHTKEGTMSETSRVLTNAMETYEKSNLGISG